MLNTKLNAHGGFTPAAVASPECDNPRTGNTQLSRLAQGRCGGTGTVPSAIYERELLTLYSGTLISILINQGRVEEHTGIGISSGICSDTWYYEDSLKNKTYCI